MCQFATLNPGLKQDATEKWKRLSAIKNHIMRKLGSLSCFALLALFIISCTKTGTGLSEAGDASRGISAGPATGGGLGNGGGTPGVMTAGEWNDLAHWDFWQILI